MVCQCGDPDRPRLRRRTQPLRRPFHFPRLGQQRGFTGPLCPPSGVGGTGAPNSLHSEHFADAWIEVGATANMQLARGVGLDIYATRTFNSLADNMVSAGLSLRKSF